MLGTLISNFKDIIYGSPKLKYYRKILSYETHAQLNSPKYLSYQGQNLVSDLQPELNFTEFSLRDKQVPEEKKWYWGVLRQTHSQTYMLLRTIVAGSTDTQKQKTVYFIWSKVYTRILASYILCFRFQNTSYITLNSILNEPLKRMNCFQTICWISIRIIYQKDAPLTPNKLAVNWLYLLFFRQEKHWWFWIAFWCRLRRSNTLYQMYKPFCIKLRHYLK